MNEKLGILVIGYKNIDGIKRLLHSLSKADYLGANNIPLIISIDYSGDQSVEDYANDYFWEFGPKHVIAYKSNLGLRKHILKCGDYIESYDLDAMAVLEDDIYVSPMFFKYYRDSVSFYSDDLRIAGISLYKHETNIFAKKSFIDYKDGGDTYFVQYAQSWGQIWMRKQWAEFKKWYESGQYEKMSLNDVPENILRWDKSWLKYHIMYLIATNKYFVYPRTSLTTNFSDVGTHSSSQTTSLQVPLCFDSGIAWKFNRLEDTKAVYDAFFESKPIVQWIGLEKLKVDLNNRKTIYSEDNYLLCNRQLNYKVLKTWGLQLRPIEANIFEEIDGKDLFLYDLSSPCSQSKDRAISTRRYEYELKSTNPLCIENFRLCFRKINHNLTGIIGKMVRKLFH